MHFASLCKLIRLLLQPVDPHIVWGSSASTNGGQMHQLSVWPCCVTKTVVSLQQPLHEFLKPQFDR